MAVWKVIASKGELARFYVEANDVKEVNDKAAFVLEAVEDDQWVAEEPMVIVEHRPTHVPDLNGEDVVWVGGIKGSWEAGDSYAQRTEAEASEDAEGD